MKRKAIAFFTVVMLVVCSVAGTSFAGVTTSYGVSSSYQFGSVPNYKSYSQTVYGKLTPAPTSPAAKLQIRDSTGVAILKSKTYPAYPLNPENTECYIGPNGDVRTFFVLPYTTNDYVWGSAEYGML